MACVKQLQCFLFLLLISPLATTLAAATSNNISLTGCPSICGNITIPYPFGMRTGCYREGFQVICDESMVHPRAFLFQDTQRNVDIELISINITSGEARIYNKHINYDCSKTISERNISGGMMIVPPAFRFSHQRNKFTAIGCQTLAYIAGYTNDTHYLGMYFSGCVSTCFQNSTINDGGSCNGLGCCQADIPAGLRFYSVFWSGISNDAWQFNPCRYAVLVEDGWYKFQVRDLTGLYFYKRSRNRAPVVLDWAIRDNGTCQDGVNKSHNTACRSSHSFCYNTSNGAGYLCQCRQGYEGNPYLTGGCIGKLFISFSASDSVLLECLLVRKNRPKFSCLTK